MYPRHPRLVESVERHTKTAATITRRGRDYPYMTTRRNQIDTLHPTFIKELNRCGVTTVVEAEERLNCTIGVNSQGLWLLATFDNEQDLVEMMLRHGG